LMVTTEMSWFYKPLWSPGAWRADRWPGSHHPRPSASGSPPPSASHEGYLVFSRKNQ